MTVRINRSWRPGMIVVAIVSSLLLTLGCSSDGVSTNSAEASPADLNPTGSGAASVPPVVSSPSPPSAEEDEGDVAQSDAGAGATGVFQPPTDPCSLLTQERAEQMLPDQQFAEGSSSDTVCRYYDSALDRDVPTQFDITPTIPGVISFDLNAPTVLEKLSLGDVGGAVGMWGAGGFAVNWVRGDYILTLAAPAPVSKDAVIAVARAINDSL